MKNVKRFLIICLCSVMVLNTAYKPIKAEASAEVGIIGGALAAAGVTLTFGQIALIVAAAGGCVYLYQNREAVAESLENYLESVAENVENGAEELKKWWDRAVLGYIAVDTAADFIKDGVKEWIEGLYTGDIVPGNIADSYIDAGAYVFKTRTLVPAGTKVKYSIYSNDYAVPRKECYVLRLRDDDVYVDGVYDFECSTVFVAPYRIYIDKPDGSWEAGVSSDYVTYNGTKYYYVIQYCDYTTSNIDEINAIFLFRNGTEKEDYSAKVSVQNFLNNYAASGFIPISENIYAEYSGGISSVLDQGHLIDDVNIPDLLIDGTGTICPDTTLTGEDVFAQSVTDTMAALQTGTMTWSDYVADVGVAAPTITLPDAEDSTTTKDYVITDTGVSDVVIDNAAAASPDLDKYKVQLRDFFPFCLPFDMVDFITVLAAEPETPVFDLKFPSINGETLDLQVDLSDWDGVAQLMRNLELLALIIGLCFKTRDIIRG